MNHLQRACQIDGVLLAAAKFPRCQHHQHGSDALRWREQAVPDRGLQGLARDRWQEKFFQPGFNARSVLGEVIQLA